MLNPDFRVSMEYTPMPEEVEEYCLQAIVNLVMTGHVIVNGAGVTINSENIEELVRVERLSRKE